jgi:hypothetical protein
MAGSYAGHPRTPRDEWLCSGADRVRIAGTRAGDDGRLAQIAEIETMASFAWRSVIPGSGSYQGSLRDRAAAALRAVLGTTQTRKKLPIKRSTDIPER